METNKNGPESCGNQANEIIANVGNNFLAFCEPVGIMLILIDVFLIIKFF